MNEVITIGVDLAKNVFQVHGVDAAGETVIRRQLRRSRLCHFSRSCLAVLLAWKPAPRPIIGGGD